MLCCPAESRMRSTVFHIRRCHSITYISDLASSVTNSHVDQLFCTQQQQHQQVEVDKACCRRSSSGVNSSDSLRHHHDDQVMCNDVDDVTESSHRRPTVDEMFCTQKLTSDNSTCRQLTPVTDPSQPCASSVDSDRKQVSLPVRPTAIRFFTVV